MEHQQSCLSFYQRTNKKLLKRLKSGYSVGIKAKTLVQKVYTKWSEATNFGEKLKRLPNDEV